MGGGAAVRLAKDIVRPSESTCTQLPKRMVMRWLEDPRRSSKSRTCASLEGLGGARQQTRLG